MHLATLSGAGHVGVFRLDAPRAAVPPDRSAGTACRCAKVATHGCAGRMRPPPNPSRSALRPAGRHGPGTTSAATGSPSAGEARRVAIGVEHQSSTWGRARSRMWSRIVRPPSGLRTCRRRPCAATGRRPAAGLPRSRHAGCGPPSFAVIVAAALAPMAGCSSSGPGRESASKTIRSSPDSARKRLPARPADQRQTGLRASSTPQAVKPERETRIGMPICTVLITISEVSRPVV